MMKKNLEIRETAKENIRILYDSLMKRSEKSSHLLNITDVLKQVYVKIDNAKDPSVLISRLVKYIYVEGFSRVVLSKDEERALMELGDLSKGASWNGMNSGDFNDKSQFYSFTEPIPQR
ncbi:bacteriocin immunity protein [Companilactobacillus huachuanensis]|uniref:Bacteriocin immunity protein n=1 Tax=Companilactobacillus huachuanensis TaxID=2559914 RepID=A0ABW1RL19_9LACO|nr:bacteriocin immunity protein [Companilactobacillus huachuanensis]